MKQQRNSASLFSVFCMSDFIGSEEEESSDESFRVEDHTEQSDNSNDDDDDEDDDDEDDSDSDGDDEPSKKKGNKHVNNADSSSKSTNAAPTMSAIEKLAVQAKASAEFTEKLLAKPICSACLSERSDDTNEIVTCDCCKITVHEGCYGVSDSNSVSSTVSSCSTEPWFCEPCKANIKNPDCELCPNKGGIFKETDCGKWVHLVCALYVPGVAFGEVDQLSSVTLFEMQYNKWGAKLCSLCENDHFARTGVCIGCDAGMCKTYFHATCAQREGLLSEAHHEEADQADPFYAHCRVHSDKLLIKHRKKNHNALVMQMKRNEAEMERTQGEKLTEEQERIERKLKNQRIKYATHKMNRPEPWVPTQKMARSLTTSASAVKKLMKKAEIMEIDSVALEFQEAQIASLTDIRKKWHIPPAFSTEFVGYYLDRTIRMREMKINLEKNVELNKNLLEQQSILRVKYDDAIKINQEVQQRQLDLIGEIEQLHNALLTISPNKQLPNIEDIGKLPSISPSPVIKLNTSSSSTPVLSSTPPPQLLTSRTMSVPTAAARKQGVGFPLNSLSKDDTGRILSTQCPSNMASSTSNSDDLLNECGICKKCFDQHLLAKCDTCHLYYHLVCLNPPLTRHPKRSKLYAWQCSECDKSDHSDDQNALVIPKGPRKSRTIRYSKDGFYSSDIIHDSFGSDKSLNNFSSASSPHRIPNGDSLNLLDFPSIISTDIEMTASTPKAQLEVTKPVVKRKRRESIVPQQPAKRGRKKKIETAETSKEVELKEVTVDLTSSPPESQELTIQPLELSVVKAKPAIKSPTSQLTVVKASSPVLKVVKSPPLPEQLTVVKSPTSKAQTKQRGRPAGSKRSQKKQPEQEIQEQSQEVKLEVNSGLLDLSQYRVFANIPNTLSTQPTSPAVINAEAKIEEIPELKNFTADQPIVDLEPLTNGVIVNGEASNDVASNSSHHKHKKRKSHKRRHSHSPTSVERQSTSSGKKHKRKHKHKDLESDPRPEQNEASIEQPRIKIKFRAILQNAGDDKKPPKFMWHVPNESAEEVNEEIEKSPLGNGHHHNHDIVAENGKKRKSPTTKKTPAPRILMSLSPKKKESLPTATENNSQSNDNDIPALINRSLPLPDEICDVCRGVGSSQNLVKCDECLKNYHFHCLMPPLKKTPKKRGYSWICADCDPTDRENN